MRASTKGPIRTHQSFHKTANQPSLSVGEAYMRWVAILNVFQWNLVAIMMHCAQARIANRQKRNLLFGASSSRSKIFATSAAPTSISTLWRQRLSSGYVRLHVWSNAKVAAYTFGRGSSAVKVSKKTPSLRRIFESDFAAASSMRTAISQSTNSFSLWSSVGLHR